MGLKKIIVASAIIFVLSTAMIGLLNNTSGKNQETIKTPNPVVESSKAEFTASPIPTAIETSIPTTSPTSYPATSTPKPTAATQSLTSTTKPSTNTNSSCKYSCSSPDRDCSDFSNHAEAQAFFNCCGFSAGYDPMRLDKSNGTGNGIACESL